MHANTHQRTTRDILPLTEPPTHQPTNPPTMCYSSTVVRTAANRCVGSYSNFVRAGRYSGENKILYQKKGTGPPPTGTKRPRHLQNDPDQPTQPPTHPPNAPTTVCYSSTAVRTAANRCVWSVLDFYFEISVGCGGISEDYPVRCRCAVWYRKTFFGRLPPFLYFRCFILKLVWEWISRWASTLFRFRLEFLMIFVLVDFWGVGLKFPHPAGGINSGDFRWRAPVVGVGDAWKDFRTNDWTLSSPGCTGSMYEP